jgi:hypothetical protein
LLGFDTEPRCIFIGVWGYPDDDKGPEPCWIDPYDCDRIGDATHWMPLPEAPNAKVTGAAATDD